MMKDSNHFLDGLFKMSRAKRYKAKKENIQKLNTYLIKLKSRKNDLCKQRCNQN